MRIPRHNRPLKLAKPWRGPKPVLPMEVIPVFTVHYLDLEEYLKLIYKMEDYSIESATGARGDMTPEINVTGCLPQTSNIIQLVDNIRLGRRTRQLGLILDLLCQDGFIPAGKYIIKMTKILRPIEQYTEVLNVSQDCLHPVCIKLKDENKNDAKFMQQVKVLDTQLLEHQKELTKLASHNGGVR